MCGQTSAQRPRISDVASMVQLFDVPAWVEAAGLSWLGEKARQRAAETKIISLFPRTELHAQLSTPLQWSQGTWRGLFSLGLHITPLVAPALAF